MSTIKKSFISDLIGQNVYNDCLSYAKPIVLIGICILAILYTLSYFFFFFLICYFIELTNGLSLLFIGFIAEAILLLDVAVDVEEPENATKKNSGKKFKHIAYKLTIIWGIILITLGIFAVYFSNKYRNHYAFECDTFLVDEERGIYHLDWLDDCDVAEQADYLEEMKGYQMGKRFTLCESCKEILIDIRP